VKLRASIPALLMLLSASPLFAQSETEMVQQMQQLQSQTAADTRIAEYFEKLKAAPRNPEIHWQLAEIYRERSLFELAIASYQRALQFNPALAKAHVGLSKVYRKQALKNWELFEMQEAVRVAPQDPEMRYALGILLMEPQTFDYNAAKKQYKELKKLQSPLADQLAATMGIQ